MPGVFAIYTAQDLHDLVEPMRASLCKPQRCPGRRSGHAGVAASQREGDPARAGFENCLAIAPGDGPSKVFVKRIAQFCAAAPGPEWNGVWSLVEK